jgi:hypothetical protein
MLEMRAWKTMKVNNQPLLPSTMLSPHLPPLPPRKNPPPKKPKHQIREESSPNQAKLNTYKLYFEWFPSWIDFWALKKTFSSIA